ncbi:tetratricopeptide repeat protein [Allohahella sp. A8]|uniref:tetratricopeptide repeat protein n=1 Tax=Allohahella sp. A8 TaxID=3141461 RepID=UPI003A81003B
MYVKQSISLLIIVMSLLSGCSQLSSKSEADEAELAAYAQGQAVLDLTVKADEAYYRRDWVKAEGLYREATKLDAGQAYLWFRLGNVLMYQTRMSEAREAYTEAINRDQGFAKAWNNLATAHLLEAREALVYLHDRLQPGDPATKQLAVRLGLLDKVLDQAMADIPALSAQ